MLRIQHGYMNREREYNRKNERKIEGVKVSGTNRILDREHRKRERERRHTWRSEVHSLTHGGYIRRNNREVIT